MLDVFAPSALSLEFVMRRAGWNLTYMEAWQHSQWMFMAEPLPMA